MDIFQRIAEERIREAMERGEFENLALSGLPLKLDEDGWIPEDLRMAYKVLKNAHCLPPELELRTEIFSLRDLIAGMDDDRKRAAKIKELNLKLLKVNILRQRPIALEDFPQYAGKIAHRLCKSSQIE
ncbi:MAG: DnaJ family domain-containing protein [bacterium]|nr:DnaJ family domain-containing protein [bacterium]